MTAATKDKPVSTKELAVAPKPSAVQAKKMAVAKNRQRVIKIEMPDPARFDELGALQGAETSLGATERFCLVCNELAEFHQNGGMGTANSGLLAALSQAGIRTTVLYTAHLELDNPEVAEQIRTIERSGASFVALQSVVPQAWMHAPRRVAYGCFWYFRKELFSYIHFSDYLGNGFYTAQAKRTGSLPGQPLIVTTVHGPTRWAMQIDERPVASLDVEEICYLETRAIEMSDVVIGVSNHILGWLRARGCSLPAATFVHKNILPVAAGRRSATAALRPGEAREIVFFARHDVRKGIRDFVAAARQLSKTRPDLKFSFLGKFSRIGGEHSGAYVLDELRNAPNLLDFRPGYDRDQAHRYLKRAGVVAVIPSVDENSPCTVFECIVEGIPFVASDVGGVAELVHETSRPTTLFAPNAKALAARLTEVLDTGLPPCRLAFDDQRIAGELFRGLAELRRRDLAATEAQAQALSELTPLVSVVITHFNRPRMLANLLAALDRQTYRNFEVIVVDDGSTDPLAQDYLDSISTMNCSYPLTMRRIPNSYLGAARNAGFAVAKGDFIKIQDDDNIPFETEIEALVRAALLTEADLVTTVSRFFRSDSEVTNPLDASQIHYFPLGKSLPLALFRNEYGDANALVRKSAFDDVGGFTELVGVGSEDYELFMKFESQEKTVVCVPEPSFNYRIAGDSMLQTTSPYRGSKRAREGLQVTNSPWLHHLINFTQECQLQRDIADQAWWKAGARTFGVLHQQLLEGDPNSPLSHERFVALALKYERVEDILPLAVGRSSAVEARQWLSSAAETVEGFSRDGRKFLTRRPRLMPLSQSANAMLISPDPEFLPTWPVFHVEPRGIFMHALLGHSVSVMIPGAIPRGSRRVGVSFRHLSEKGGRVHVSARAIWHTGVQAKSPAEPVPPGGTGTCTFELEKPASQVLDLVLHVHVEETQDFAWMMAEQLILEE